MRKKTTQEFIKELKITRPDVTVIGEYVSAHTPIKLRCKCGWEYEQQPNKTLKNQKSCPICGNASNYNQTTETFIERANRKHKNFYDYTKSIYTKASQHLIITCPVHGDFEQTPSNHLSGQGCPKCATESRKEFIGWTYSEWEKAGLQSKKFDSFKLYIIRCYDPNTSEEFYKIGKTFTKVSYRFKSTALPYEYEVITTREGSARFISDLENTIIQKNKNNKYTPKKVFNGFTECFVKVEE